MSTLRLGVHRLPAAEVVVIQTIVRLSAHDGAFPWKLVDVPPYDALLVDGTTTEGGCPEAAAMARAVLTLTRMSSGDLPNTLERPIRAEKLQQWLKNTERELLAAQPALPTTDEQTAMEMEVSDSVRFMLRRWPPAALRGNDSGNVRMASLLSRCELNASELADLSQQSFSRCVGFLQALRRAGVLEVHPESILPRETELPIVPKLTGAVRSALEAACVARTDAQDGAGDAMAQVPHPRPGTGLAARAAARSRLVDGCGTDCRRSTYSFSFSLSTPALRSAESSHLAAVSPFLMASMRAASSATFLLAA